MSAALRPALAAALAVYALITGAYSLGLRRVAVVDLGVVANGFVIRVLAGGLATGVPVSSWLLIVVSFAALFVVAGKRYHDLVQLGPQREASPRQAGRVHTQLPALRVRPGRRGDHHRLLPVGLGRQRAARWPGGAVGLPVHPHPCCATACCWRPARVAPPEEVLLGDRGLQILTVAWALVYLPGIYPAG